MVTPLATTFKQKLDFCYVFNLAFHKLNEKVRTMQEQMVNTDILYYIWHPFASIRKSWLGVLIMLEIHT